MVFLSLVGDVSGEMKGGEWARVERESDSDRDRIRRKET